MGRYLTHKGGYIMLEYIWLSITAWFMGFFPLFEIYLAIPSTMALGLDMVSSIVWSGLGTFIAIPFIVYFFDFLSRIQWMKRFLLKMAKSKYSEKIRKNSFWFILLATPIVGTWTIGVIGKLTDMNKHSLLLVSAISITIYGILIGILTQLGIDFLTR